MENFEEQVKQEWENFGSKRENYFPNILILGRTGCGKSSLINTVFERYIAPVSDSTPETQDFDIYLGKNYDNFVNLIDSKGYELNDDPNKYFDIINNKIIEMKQENKKVHLAWFGVSVAGNRIENVDINVLKKINKIEQFKGRICIVFTQCDEDDENGSKIKEFRKILKEDLSNIKSFETSSKFKDMEGLELEKLVEWSANCIEEDEVRECFIASQSKSLELKRKQAMKSITLYTAGSATIGASPIPFSDAALLVPTQIAMIVHITRIYGMQTIAKISSSVVSSIIITQIGKSIVGNLLKFIPMVGTWVGGAINATVAGAITFALGTAISEICYRTCKAILNGENVDFEHIFDMVKIKDEFEKTFKEKMDQNKDK